MKKKSVILVTLIMALLLSGCSMPNIPFLNKGDTPSEEQPSDVPGDGSDRVFPVNGLSFHVGDSITVSDLVTIDESQVVNVLQSVVIIDGVPTVDSYTITEAGSFTYTVMVEFIDGVVYSGDVYIEVEESGVELPEELHNNIAEKEWHKMNLAEFSTSITPNESDVMVSYCDDNNCKIIEIGVPYDTNSIVNSCVMYYLPKNSSIPISPFTNDAITIAAFRLILGWDTTIDNVPEELASLMYLTNLYQESVTASSTDIATSLYDTAGNAYPLKEVIYTIDMTAYGGGTYTMSDILYSDIGDGYVIIYINKVQGAGESTELGTTQMPTFESYDAFLEYVRTDDTVIKSFEMMANSRPTQQTAARIGKGLSSLIILGDVTTLLPSKEPEAIVVTEPTEIEQPEASGVVGELFTPYSAKYPQIYTWAEDEIKYRRWVYTIENNTQYISSIIYPDGTQRISGANGNDDWRIDLNNGETGSSTTTQPDNTSKYNLSSQYARYTITASNDDNTVFDPANSSSGRLSLKYKGKQYYIETVRATQIQNYTANSLYPTSGMYNAEYTITQKSENNKTTNLGVINPYVMKYKDSKQKEQETGYMAVYNISNDYLCIYGEEIGLDVRDMMDILDKMVTMQ